MNNAIPLSVTMREHIFSVLVDCMGDDGLASKDGFSIQPGQRDYAQRWAETLSRAAQGRLGLPDQKPHLLMLGADTGTGKTIGYSAPLLALACTGQRVAIATHSHQLQRQLIGTPENPGDLVRVAGWMAALGHGQLKIARRLGAQAFISCAAVDDLLQALKNDKESWVTAQEIADVQALLDFAIDAMQGKNSGLIEDAIEQFGGQLPVGISSSDVCLNSLSPQEDREAFEAHLATADDADVVIMTHHYIAACAMYRNGKLSNRGFAAIVVDEADRLSATAETAFQFNLSLRRLESVLERIPGAVGRDAVTLAGELSGAVSSVQFGKNQRSIALSATPISTQSNIASHLGVLNETVKVIARRKGIDPKLKVELDEASSLMSRVLNSKPNQSFAAAISISPTRKFPSISIAPLAPGRMISRLWSNELQDDDEAGGVVRESIGAMLFTSATMGTPGRVREPSHRFKNIAFALNVPTQSNDRCYVDTALWEQFEPIKFGAVHFILADPSLPSPVKGVDEDSAAELDTDWLAYAAKMVAKAHSVGGRTLVLTGSYKETALLAKELVDIGVKVIEQTRLAGAATCIDKYKLSENAIWLSPTSWEGLNLPGMIQNLVITRLPMQATDELTRAIMSAQGKLTNASVQSILHANAMNAAKRKFRQGFGRAIRSKTDKARIWIADPRFPVAVSSPIVKRHFAELSFGRVKFYPAFHEVIPERFRRKIELAQILMKNGDVLS